MKVKILIIVIFILFGIVIFMGINMYERSKEVNGDVKSIHMADQHYNCLENPIDPLFAEALSNSHVRMEYGQIQQLYYDTWIAQYHDIMKKIRKKCIYDDDLANYTLFTNEMENGFEKLQPLILNEMLDNYHIPDSPEKDSWGNGTQGALRMYQGTMYRNACMFFIPYLEKSEYTFPITEIKELLSQITKEQ